MIIDGKIYCDYCYNRYGIKRKSICDNFSFIDLFQDFKFSSAVCDLCLIYFKEHFYDNDWAYWYHEMLRKESEELEGKK